MINTDKDLIGTKTQRGVLHVTKAGFTAKLQRMVKPNWDKDVVEFHLPKHCSTIRLAEFVDDWDISFEAAKKLSDQEIGEIESDLEVCEMVELTDYEELIEIENEFGMVHWCLPAEEIAEDLVIYYAEDSIYINSEKLTKYLLDNHEDECKMG